MLHGSIVTKFNMLFLSSAALALLPVLSLVSAQSECIAFEGRVAADAVAADFDASTSVYDPKYDLGEGRFSKIV